MSRIISARFLLLVALAALAAGCGSGGGGSSNPVTPSSSDWGTLIWDQDNWA